MTFTFCTISFNQEHLILQQLESIKYQITQYGHDVECHYVLADDHSSDNTREKVELWLKKNPGLFESAKIIDTGNNKGIVANYTNALKEIETDYFKITAADDFYYKNNIFEIYQDANVVIAQTIHLNSDNTVVAYNNRFMKKLVRFGDNNELIKNFVLKQYRYGGGIEAPGVFLSRSIIDEGLFQTLSPLKWIEDVAEWMYLMGNKNTKVRIEPKPLIVYRVDIGISHKPRSKEYLQDALYLRTNYQTRLMPGKRLSNPYFYLKIIEREMLSLPQLIKKEGRIKAKEFRKEQKKEYAIASDYIKDIIKKADDFEREIKQRVVCK